MIDTTTETLISLKEARLLFPKRVSMPTLWRWVLRGINGVKLESVKIGGRRYTSKQACQRFIELSASDKPLEGKRQSKKEQTPNPSIAHANSILDQFGV